MYIHHLHTMKFSNNILKERVQRKNMVGVRNLFCEIFSQIPYMWNVLGIVPNMKKKSLNQYIKGYTIHLFVK